MSKFHTDEAQEQYNDKVKKFLEEEGKIKSKRAPHWSSSNAFEERRMGILFVVARAALMTHLKSRFWSFAALDAIDKTSYFLIKRDGTLSPSHPTAIMLHGNKGDDKEGPKSFLPYGQQG